ncbi:hypothetical protein BKP56_12645 [Marinilactibacillus sp. 15R]|uniref:hypothetical protein n=1 Tax=Marinilactibacillus sp. 15R TaxID=1911586 RepID=UPI00090950BA|nr:hypothetical protein [Marinilactibacillus sp. 15R]API90053.1 hypothetical protein BKP56_12645 [Marinilactibacillus sp. 15R]
MILLGALGNVVGDYIANGLKFLFNQNAVPLELFEMDVTDYQESLRHRRKLIASKVRAYYDQCNKPKKSGCKSS